MGKVNLTAKRVARLLKKPGRYRDTEVKGLLLVVRGPDNASWALRYEKHGRERWHGLGPVSLVALKLARERARAARLQLLDGVDPIDSKRAAAQKAKLAAAKAMTFADAAQAYNDQHEKKWRNRKAAAQFLSTLRQYAFPALGALPVAAIDTALVLRVLEQKIEAERGYAAGRFWDARPETASRVRGRIENVLDWAAVRGLRTGDNPARWRGHLENVLPARSQLAETNHHAALPFQQLPEFMSALRQRAGTAAAALEFTVLTAARTGEVIGAKWDEVNFADKLWTVPAGRMKAAREHKVPLSARALEILQAVPYEDANEYIFIGPRRGGLSNAAMSAVLRRMGHGDITVHGFRSSFRDWAAESTSYPNHVVEMALAHAIGDKVEAAYRRGDLAAKRRKLMEAWARYAAGRK